MVAIVGTIMLSVGFLVGFITCGLLVSGGPQDLEMPEPPLCPRCGQPKQYGGPLWLDHARCERRTENNGGKG